MVFIHGSISSQALQPLAVRDCFAEAIRPTKPSELDVNKMLDHKTNNLCSMYNCIFWFCLAQFSKAFGENWVKACLKKLTGQVSWKNIRGHYNSYQSINEFSISMKARS